MEAWAYPIAAVVLLTGTLDRTRIRHVMHCNWLRLTAIFFLLSVAFHQFDRFVRPATDWVVRALVDQLAWTPREAAIRYAVEFPFAMFWMVTWAVTISIVIKALASPAPSAEPDRHAPQSA